MLRVIAAGLLGSRGVQAQDVMDVPSLGAIAEARGLLFGSAFDNEILDNQSLRDLYRHQVRILTTDVSMKFGPIRPEEDQTRFQPADRLVDFANSEGIPLRGHNLIWNEANPAWLSKISSSRREYWLERHIDEVMTRYAGRVQSWDVVNEPFWPGHRKPEGFRDGPWYAAMGKDYIRRAFVRASQTDRQVKLALNESGAEWWTKETPIYRAGMLRLIDEIREAGARIDIIGLECHWMSFLEHDPGSLAEFLARLAEKKVEIYISELDVDDSKMPDEPHTRDRLVADRYASFLELVLREPAVKAVITWELADGASWYRSIYKPPAGSNRKPRPLPFDENMRPKLAYEAVAGALRSRKTKA